MIEVRRGDPRYPASLNDLDQPPARLFAIGDVGTLDDSPARAVAIVGTRDATAYGLRVALGLAEALAEAGAVVVSGLARGVDTAAHQGALRASRPTVAVLGTGVDVPYPAGNRGLHRAVASAGLVLSESPPGTKAFRGCFPRRNRIIAALTHMTVVVEAGFKSGALNTASQALDLGRVVAAVPGPIDCPTSAGCNALIRDGAQVITTVDDAIALMGLSRKRTASRIPVGDDDATVFAEIMRGVSTVDALIESTGLPPRAVAGAIGRLEVAGLAATSHDGRIGPLTLDACDVVSMSTR